MIANNDDIRLDASQYARAITRWENEGGAPEHGRRLARINLLRQHMGPYDRDKERGDLPAHVPNPDKN
jgi:hypothetical protein